MFLVGCAALLLAVAGLSHVQWDADGSNVLPPGLPEVEGLNLLRESFSKKEEMVVTLRGDSPEGVSLAARSLVEVLVARRDIAAVADPRHIEDRLAGSGALTLGPGEQKAAVAMLAYAWLEAPEEHFSRLASLLRSDEALFAQLEDASERLQYGDVADAMRLQRDPLDLLRLDWAGAELADRQSNEGDGGRFRILYVRASETGDMDADTAIDWMESVRASAAAWSATAPEAEGIQLRFTGEAVQLADTIGGMRRDLGTSAVTTFILVISLFWLIHRRVAPLVSLALMLLLVFLVTFGLAGWLFDELSILGVGFAAILLGLAVDYGAIIYQESLGESADTRAIRRAAGPGVIWGAVTTAFVFLGLHFSSIPGIRQLGELVAMGLLVAALVMLGWFAHVAARLRFESHAPPVPWRRLDRASWKRLATTPALLVVFVCILLAGGLPEVNRDFSILRPKHSEALDAYEEIQQVFNRSEAARIGFVIHASDTGGLLAVRDQAERKLRAAVEAGEVADYQLPGRNASAVWRLLDREEEVLAVIDRHGLFGDEAKALLRGFFRTWRVILTGDPGGVPFAEDGVRLSGLDRLFSVDTPSRAWLGMVDAADRDRFAARDFSWAEGLVDDHFHLAGWEAIGPALLRTVWDDFGRIGLPMGGLLLVMLWLAFRNLRDLACALSALAFGALALLVLMRLLGWEWNFLNLSAIPLLFGSGLDYTIHMVLALRRSEGDLAVVRKGVRKALLFCALSTAAGFSSLAFAGNLGLSSLGRVCALGIFCIMLFSVYFLPQWWLFLHRSTGAARLAR